MLVKGYKLLVISSGDLRFSLVITVNGTIVYP